MFQSKKDTEDSDTVKENDRPSIFHVKKGRPFLLLHSSPVPHSLLLPVLLEDEFFLDRGERPFNVFRRGRIVGETLVLDPLKFYVY